MTTPTSSKPLRYADVCKTGLTIRTRTAGTPKVDAIRAGTTTQQANYRSADTDRDKSPTSGGVEERDWADDIPPDDPYTTMWAEANQEWWVPEPIPARPLTFEEALAQQALHHSDLARLLVPYWLKGMKAAERGEDFKLEAFWDDFIAERRATGWWWSMSDYNKSEKGQQDGWSAHRASNHENDLEGGWGTPDRWGNEVQGWPDAKDESVGRGNEEEGWKQVGNNRRGRGGMDNNLDSPWGKRNGQRGRRRGRGRGRGYARQ